MTARALMGSHKRDWGLAARYRDRDYHDDEKGEGVQLSAEDLADIKADSDLRQQVRKLEQLLREANERIALLEKQVPAEVAESKYISASEFARRHRVAVSTITRKYHAQKLRGHQDKQGYIWIDANENYAKYQSKKAS